MTHTTTAIEPTSLITTAIPYVNAPPHLGHALETVITDVIARYRRQHGANVHHQSGTDDHALKNAQAAAERGLGTAELVAQNAALLRIKTSWTSVRDDSFCWTFLGFVPSIDGSSRFLESAHRGRR